LLVLAIIPEEVYMQVLEENFRFEGEGENKKDKDR